MTRPGRRDVSASTVPCPSPAAMSRLTQQYETDGFYGIGVLNSEGETNVGTLWRSAFILGAAFIFTIGRKVEKQSSDVTRAWTKIPLFHYASFDEFRENLPFATKLVGVEMTPAAEPLVSFEHPTRAVYLLGCESTGLPEPVVAACHSLVVLPGHFSLNVAVAGSLVACDRVNKLKVRLPGRIFSNEV